MKINLQKVSEEVKEELNQAAKGDDFISTFKDIDKAEDSGTFSVVASTEDVDRAGEVVQADGWDLENFKSNPVILFGHSHNRLPIGKATSVRVEDNQLKLEGKFATHDFAQKVRQLHDQGVMNAVSVGFIARERDGNIITKAELLEVSFVSVPANPNALVSELGLDEMITLDAEVQDEEEDEEEEEAKEVEEEEEPENDDDKEDKGTIPYSVHGEGPKAAEQAEWDGDKEVAKATGDEEALEKMHTWVDSTADDFDADERQWYKLPHHKGSGSQQVVWRGVKAAMAALNGARGGVDIPEEDMKRAYDHLVKHYEEFDKEPPALERDYTDEELKQIEKHGNVEEKEGRVLSATNRKKVMDARDALNDLLEASSTDDKASPSEDDTDGEDESTEEDPEQALREVMQGTVHKFDKALAAYRERERENYKSNN